MGAAAPSDVVRDDMSSVLLPTIVSPPTRAMGRRIWTRV